MTASNSGFQVMNEGIKNETIFSQDKSIETFFHRTQGAHIALQNDEKTRQHSQSQKRTTSVPSNKISAHRSLGSFSSLNNLQAKSIRRTPCYTEDQPADNKNSTWGNVSKLKSTLSSVLKPQTSNTVGTLDVTRNSYIAVAGQSARAGNKISASGGITLKQGRQWETAKRPVITISSCEMLRVKDNPVDVQANKRMKRDREGKQLFQLEKKPRTLQCYFEEILTSRGYSIETFCALDTGYHCKPTSLQKASYGNLLVQAIRSNNISFVSKLLECGLSSNACNRFGESIIHMVCRRGNYELLKVFTDAGCSVQVSDDFGRTPLHDACWTSEPCFKSVELILEKDLRLLNIRDCRGFTPLSYVKKQDWSKWIEFFNRKKDIYWLARDKKILGDEGPPHLSTVKPNTNAVKDPENATSIDVATMLASGAMSPDDRLAETSSTESISSLHSVRCQ
eukprot:CAMPEP_0197828134 /NCGR_PEP_ID=MMETSP1437-20131217/4773_1 /TAXON_ID=49252 ORGANISM="Eucampia antarctica, Strain CCMP1452" /NCGR_SAMPLE_ID=MMETSP1437 /ASSEMBLY_ACC=CAM_ASM_001096 /LENGTH=450 /DNA_ID=CAMNT_0043429251 /DNA_START=162 /DNA_END=1514 /DNA_ORIENTATION=-